MVYRIGVDIGGSFTDFALFNEETKELKSLKTFSRPDSPGADVMTGLALAQERYGVRPEDISYFTHGTTVGVNTVIQRNGIKLALFTTDGFRDVLELARLKIPDMYNLLSKRPEPLIPRDMVFGIPGRMDSRGAEIEPVDEAAVRAAARAALDAQAEGIVVSLLHSYRNSIHEAQVKSIIEDEVTGLPVFCSSDTWPMIREYERTITTVVGGYVQPRVAQYLSSLQKGLADAGVTSEPRLTKSNGGVMTAEQGKSECVQMILSGTASGVIGAAHIARISGLDQCMSLDIGGTSADVAVIIDGEPQYGVGERIGEFQVYIPSVSVTSIGEGGGSIAWIDPQGILRVGPESAGSSPGPACYGSGGDRATITDAFVVLGAIGHADLGYNAVKIDSDASHRVVGVIATELGQSVEYIAEAIIDIAVSGMYTEVSALASRFGIDPREFSLQAFGGAGPMIGCFLARELKMKEIVVPQTPGVLSALGGLIADVKNDFLKTVYTDATPEVGPILTKYFAELKTQALEWLREGQGYQGDYDLIYSAEMRYRGQSFEIDTRLDERVVESGDVAAIVDAFHEEHARIYDHADRNAAVQIVSIRLVILGKTAKPDFIRHTLEFGAAKAHKLIPVWIDGAMRDAGLYLRSDLRPGQHFDGPAVVMQDDTTTVIPPGYVVKVDELENLRITAGERK